MNLSKPKIFNEIIYDESQISKIIKDLGKCGYVVTINLNEIIVESDNEIYKNKLIYNVYTSEVTTLHKPFEIYRLEQIIRLIGLLTK